MKENKTTLSVGFYGSLIMANTTENVFLTIIWVVISGAYMFLLNKKIK